MGRLSGVRVPHVPRTREYRTPPRGPQPVTPYGALKRWSDHAAASEDDDRAAQRAPASPSARIARQLRSRPTAALAQKDLRNSAATAVGGGRFAGTIAPRVPAGVKETRLLPQRGRVIPLQARNRQPAYINFQDLSRVLTRTVRTGLPRRQWEAPNTVGGALRPRRRFPDDRVPQRRRLGAPIECRPGTPSP